MTKIQKIIFISAAILGIAVGVLTGYYQHKEQVVPDGQTDSYVLGGYNITGGTTYRLKSPAATTDSVINLSSFKEPVSNIPYTMTYINTDIGYGTIEPQNPSNVEFISFTGITQNSDGSARLTGVTRGLTKTPAGPSCTASTTLKIRHPAQSVFIYTSDSPCHFSEYAVRRNDETITGQWSFPYASASSSPVTLGQLNATALGTTMVDRLIVTGTAGETITGGQVLYLKQSDSRWYKASVSIAEASSTLLGLAQGSGTVGVSISGGVLLHGLDSFNIGLTSGANYFISSTAGATSTATSSRSIGRARNTTSLYFDSHHLSDIVGVNNIFTGTQLFSNSVTFSASTTITSTSTLTIGSFPAYNIGKNISVLTSVGTSTFTVPSGISKLKVELVGGGGSGGAGSNNGTSGGGGGGGGYSMEYIDVSSTSTIQYFVGNTGEPTKFGTNGFYLSATGGSSGTNGAVGSGGSGGSGGTGSGGDLNLSGKGGGGATISTNESGSGSGGDSYFGGGGRGIGGLNDTAGEASGNYGGGGGGGTGSGGAGGGSQGVIVITW